MITLEQRVTELENTNFIILKTLQELKNLMIAGFERIDAQFAEMRVEMKGMRKDVAIIKEDVAEMRITLRS